MSAVDSTKRPFSRTALLLAAAASLLVAQEPTLVRLRDAVGDTIDLAERDSFHLFPNTAWFGHAVILAVPGPEFFARVTPAGTDTSVHVYFRIMPTELERIRFLVDNREYMTVQVRSDSNAALALATFWRGIEDRPLRNIAGEPADVQHIVAKPPEAETAGQPADVQSIKPRRTEATTDGGPQLPLVTSENRYNYTLHGMALGSCVGGCIGSWAGLQQVGYNYYGECASGPVYSVNNPVFWTATCGLTALGSTAGYMVGDKLDHKPVSLLPLPKEGKGWRTGCAIGAAIPGLLLGTVFFALAGGSHYGKTGFFDEIENDPSDLTYLPLALTGLCVAVEVTTIGYRIGRSIDRNNAAKAEAKRRALGR